MAFNSLEATQKAFGIVTTALTSGSIKLAGSTGALETATKFAASDAAYLSKLLTDLSASIQSMG